MLVRRVTNVAVRRRNRDTAPGVQGVRARVEQPSLTVPVNVPWPASSNRPPVETRPKVGRPPNERWREVEASIDCRAATSAALLPIARELATAPGRLQVDTKMDSISVFRLRIQTTPRQAGKADSWKVQLFDIKVESPYSYWFACRRSALKQRPVCIFHDWLFDGGAAA
jgi:hypothetical protein